MKSTARTGAKRTARRSPKAAELPADARERILQASRRLLAAEGWRGLTVSAICEEADVYRAAVNYHFGSKEGLAAVLLEDLVRDAARRVMVTASEMPLSDDRVVETIRGYDMLGGKELQVAFFESFSHLMRSPKLRFRLVELYRHANGFAALALGSGAPDALASLYPFAEVLVAFVDGLIIQQLVEPNKDFEPMINAFVSILTPAVAEVVERSGVRQRVTPGATAK